VEEYSYIEAVVHYEKSNDSFAHIREDPETSEVKNASIENRKIACGFRYAILLFRLILRLFKSILFIYLIIISTPSLNIEVRFSVS